MISKRKTCAGWDCNTHPAFIWKRINGKPYCKMCAYRIEKDLSENQETNLKKIENTQILHNTMLNWWKSLGTYKYCENCGLILPTTFSVNNVHHLLPKAKYRDVSLNTSYFMLLCNDCHGSYEISPNRIKHKTIFDRMNQALKNYNEDLL